MSHNCASRGLYADCYHVNVAICIFALQMRTLWVFRSSQFEVLIYISYAPYIILPVHAFGVLICHSVRLTTPEPKHSDQSESLMTRNTAI